MKEKSDFWFNVEMMLDEYMKLKVHIQLLKRAGKKPEKVLFDELEMIKEKLIKLCTSEPINQP